MFKTTVLCVMLAVGLTACAGLLVVSDEGSGNGGSGGTGGTGGDGGVALLTTMLNALPGNAKALVNWDTIAPATGYQVEWTGPIDPAVLAGIDVNALDSIADLQEALAAAGEDVAIGMSDAGDLITLTHEGLTNGRAYCYVAHGFRDAEEVGYSNIGCTVPLGMPVAATVAHSLAVTLNWDPADGAVSYNVYKTLLNPMASLSKAVGDTVICEGVDEGTFLEQTELTTIEDTVDISNCEDYCYAVKPLNMNGQESEELVTWILAAPSTVGELDVDFANGGTFTLDDETGRFSDLALTADDSIIVTDNSDLQVAAIKYAADMSSVLWSVDLSGVMKFVNALELKEDAEGGEQVYVVGAVDVAVNDYRMVVCKIVDGSLDMSFGSGPVPTGCYWHGLESMGNDVTLDASGNIIVGGTTGPITINSFAVWSIDPSGRVVNWQYLNADPKYTRMANAVTVADIGGTERVFATGSSFDLLALIPSYRELMVVALDSETGTELGWVSEAGAGGDTVGNDIIFLSDGTVLVSGASQTGALGTPGDIYLWNYPSNLSAPDIFIYDRDEDDKGEGVDVDCRDRIVIAGNAGVLGFNELAMIRVDDLFFLDNAFGNLLPDPDGWYVHDVSVSNAYHWAEDSRGRYVAAGWLQVVLRAAPALLRLK